MSKTFIIPITIVLLFTLWSISAIAQSFTGVWEGVVKLTDAKSDRLNFRMELMQEGNDCYGVLYSRGYKKNTMFGCDYIVTGKFSSNTLQLRWANVQRAISMTKEDCSQMAALLLEAKDSVTLSGIWQWTLGESITAECKKVNDSVSFSAKEEFSLYKTAVMQSYEELKIFLKAEDRFTESIYNGDVDSSDLVVEIRSMDSTARDSIDVYLNGEVLTTVNNLNKTPLRLRMKDLPTGENDLIVVNKSASSFKALLGIVIQHKGMIQEKSAAATGATNLVLYFIRQ